MNGSTHTIFKPSLLLSALLGGIIFTSCGSKAPTADSGALQISSSPATISSPAAKSISESGKNSTAKPQSRLQLVKTAELSLSVNSIDKSVQAIFNIVKQKQGDVYKFEDEKPQKDNSRQTASMEVKVPQEQLEPTLDELAKLGTVQHRTLKAEDVTDQLVDNQARLRNLRQQESSLLKILERSGSIGDVLKVSQEVSNVRESIERLDAQLKSLQNRVAYSTITLNMEAEVAGLAPQTPLVSQVKETWENATNSVSKLTVSLVRLSLWFVAFSPYLLILGGAAFAYKQMRKSQPRNSAQAPNSSSKL